MNLRGFFSLPWQADFLLLPYKMEIYFHGSTTAVYLFLLLLRLRSLQRRSRRNAARATRTMSFPLVRCLLSAPSNPSRRTSLTVASTYCTTLRKFLPGTPNMVEATTSFSLNTFCLVWLIFWSRVYLIWLTGSHWRR